MTKANPFAALKWLSLAPALLLGGCDMTLFNPKGQVGMDERTLIITATLLMLIVVIPVIVMTWRSPGSTAPRTPRPSTSRTGTTPTASRRWSGWCPA